MSRLFRIAAMIVLLAAAPAAGAEVLRCNGNSAGEGDSQLSVRYKCGEPLLAQSFCAPVYTIGSRHPLPLALGAALVPCQVIDEWLYDRGPGHLMATVRFRAGVVQSIRYGRVPD